MENNVKGEVKLLLTFLQIILSITVALLAGFALITKNFELQPYMILVMSFLMLVMGLRENQKERKGFGLFYIGIFIFLLIVSLIII